MTSVQEAITARSELAGDLAAGVELISEEQSLTFTQYTKVILPVDQFIFWVRSDQLSVSAILNASRFNTAAYNEPPSITVAAPQLTAKGSLHWANTKQQNQDETLSVNQIVFTSEVEVIDLNAVGQNTIYIATIGKEKVRYAFSQRKSFYKQAGLYHYVGTALYPAMATQVVDDVSQFNDAEPIVSNSLPLWLALNSYEPLPGQLPSPVRLYPSFAVEENLEPPYGVVHIGVDDTSALQPVPYLDSDLNHWQLAQDKVKITLYGLRNAAALDFLDAVEGYMTNGGAFGLMNAPLPKDAKRTQVEFNTLAQKKEIEFVVSYYQQTARNIARSLIKQALVNWLPT